jgi:23S rRNA A2030 N6-methylase RlmJ
LRVEFKRDGTEVSFRVLQQDEALRGQGVLIKRNGKAITSIQHPAVGLKNLFVRGRNIGKDYYIDVVRYDSEKEAEEEIATFCALIEELNRDREEKTVGGPKLKVQFIRDGAKVTMKVLEQDETLRSTNGGKEVLNKGGYAVWSWAFPAIDPNIIYIRGSNRDKDEISDTLLHLSPEAAKAAVDAFSKLIEEINNMDHRIVGGDRLQVEFWLEGARLRARVLKQDDGLRDVGTIRSEDKYFIRSISLPAIVPDSMDVNGSVLYVRGLKRSEDSKTVEEWFPSPLAAREALEAFTRLIEKINNEEHRIVGGPRLKVEFWREGYRMTMQVLEQAEELRGKDLLADDGEYFLRSRCCPALVGRTLYVRGRDGGCTDKWKAGYAFNTSEEAIKSLAHFTKLIEQINAEQTKTLEIGPYVVKATLIGDKLEISHERREVA